MARLEIPERRKKGFEYFIALKKNDRNRLIKELSKLPKGLAFDDMVADLSHKLQVKKNEVEAIVRTFFSLLFARESYEMELDTFVDQIIQALAESENEKLTPDDVLKQQLVEILDTRGSFYIIYKANALISEREKLLEDTRVLTDVRPVFNDDETNYSVEGFLIVHNLKVVYHESGFHKEIFIALDKNDLEKLKQQISRSENKERKLREQLKQLNIAFLNQQ